MIEILYFDKHIAVCHKPSGLLCEGEGKDSLPEALRDELLQRGVRDPRIFPVHRLDRETEGIVVYALRSDAAARLSAQISEGKWEKIYNAWLWGVPTDESGSLSDLLYYDRRLSKSFVVDRERKGVKQALLDYKVLGRSSDGRRTLVKIELHTGRTHQIRVQFASRGLPLCGDRRYGAPSESGKQLLLAAVELSFYHPSTSERMTFKIESEMMRGAVSE